MTEMTVAPKTSTHPEALPVPMNMQDLLRYEAYIAEIPRVNALNAAYYTQMFLEAKDLAAGFHAKLLYEYERAKTATKEQQALSYLERSNDYIEKKALKSTDEIRKQYVQIDPGYKAAREVEDYLCAAVKLLEGKTYKFNDAFEAVQLIFRKTQDPMGSRSALPSGKDAQ